MASAILVLVHDWPAALPIETPRVSMEPLAVSHAPEMREALADPGLYRYIGGAPPSLRELTERYSRQAAGRSADGEQGWLNWIIRRRDSGDAIGFTQATLHGEGSSVVADIAWVVAARHQGRGFASEAAAAMRAWLRGRGIDRCIAFIAPANLASERVARTLGLHPTEEVVDGEVRWESSPAARNRSR